jgi:hypothetical protein
MLPDRLQNLGRILGRPLEPVGSVDVGHTEPGGVALVPFEVARRVESITSAMARFGCALRKVGSSDSLEKTPPEVPFHLDPLLVCLTELGDVKVVIFLTFLVVDDLFQGPVGLVLDGEPVLGDDNSEAVRTSVLFVDVVEELSETPGDCRGVGRQSRQRLAICATTCVLRLTGIRMPVMTPPTDRHAVLLRDLLDSGTKELEPAHLAPFDDFAGSPLGTVVIQPEAAIQGANISSAGKFERSISAQRPRLDSQIG